MDILELNFTNWYCSNISVHIHFFTDRFPTFIEINMKITEVYISLFPNWIVYFVYNCMILLAISSTNRLSCSTNISVGFASFIISSICILDITSM